jgi:hypothetical protein
MNHRYGQFEIQLKNSGQLIQKRIKNINNFVFKIIFKFYYYYQYQHLINFSLLQAVHCQRRGQEAAGSKMRESDGRRRGTGSGGNSK